VWRGGESHASRALVVALRPNSCPVPQSRAPIRHAFGHKHQFLQRHFFRDCRENLSGSLFPIGLMNNHSSRQSHFANNLMRADPVAAKRDERAALRRLSRSRTRQGPVIASPASTASGSCPGAWRNNVGGFPRAFAAPTLNYRAAPYRGQQAQFSHAVPKRSLIAISRIDEHHARCDARCKSLSQLCQCDLRLGRGVQFIGKARASSTPPVLNPLFGIWSVMQLDDCLVASRRTDSRRPQLSCFPSRPQY
jgi:hypothetical protein